jgi:beta-1,4-N-acetylglucosaminyltransferase
VKICLVTSCGGHLSELRKLMAVYQPLDHFYVLDDRIELPADMSGRTYFVAHAERTWRVIVNVWEAWRILRRERPDVILSTGAGVAVSFGLVGKLFRLPMIFIECSTQVTQPSLAGRIMYHLADRFFYQWPGLDRHYPRGTYGGLLA